MKGLTALFKALSDETRLRIVKLLEQRELCVCDIVAALAIVQPKASFHLGVLKEAGLVRDRKAGKWIHYRLDETDLFRRMLMVSVCEKAEGPQLTEDRKRLERFLKTKKSGPGCETKKVAACSCGA